MRLAVALTIAVFMAGLGTWAMLRHEAVAGISILLTIPLIAWQLARGKGCGRCRRRGCDSEDLIVM